MKLGLVVHYEKEELIPIGEVTLKIFLAQLCPFFDLEFLCRRGAKTWTFCNISVVTEDIYLKLGLVVHYEKGTHTNRGGNPQNIFGTVMPLLDLEFLLKNGFTAISQELMDEF